MEMTNRFKGLDLKDRMPEELWMEVRHCTGGSDQDHPQEKKNAKRQNGFWGGLTNSWKKKRQTGKAKEKKERYIYLNAEFQRIAKRDRKAFLSHQCREMMVS